MNWRDGHGTVRRLGRERTALVVSVGGADGAYGVVIMKALFEGDSPATGYTQLDPSIFTGTSAGAYNAAFMVSQGDTDNRAVVAVLARIWIDQISGGGRACGNGVYRIRGNPFCY